MQTNRRTSRSPDDIEPTAPSEPDGAGASGLTRRRLLQHAGTLGLAAVAVGSIGAESSLAALRAARGATAAALTLTPEQEQGPFYVGIEKIRKNITLGRPGVPLHLQIRVVTTTGKPVEDAACDIWQCDATGVYSDESSQSTVGQTWLRGVQFTGADGLASFVTIYPGHYQGRATHIHIKVHVAGKAAGTTYAGGHVSHTGQLLFDDAVSSQVFKLAPYTSDTAARVLNTDDHVYTTQGGSKVLVKLSKLGVTVSKGYSGAITLIVDPASTPAGIGAGG
jgi:protocatechuate 3,4-dioxygenase beta subunit